jgi:2-polyprenyl-3-methyl-5-hydroxy-6-metoxy-1,4-benzoquinol methylase
VTVAIARSLSASNANVEFHATALTEVTGTGYDVVTAIAVVHHLDLSEALTAMRRLTKTGVKLLIVDC